MTDLDWPDVDVVIPHYSSPNELRWVLNALAAQRYPHHRVHVFVSDDGSPHRPEVPSGVRLLTQPDEGFRAALARNRGAQAGSSPYLLFLDCDTLPEPTYVAEMVTALVDADQAGFGALVVGRRRHADFEGAYDEAVASFLAAAGEPGDGSDTSIPRLPEPSWLSDGYARTDNLTAAGQEDWRLVISAVMGVTREHFERLGGFDASLVGYGGEDWEFAYRTWNLGVELRHAPDAVAWHNGPDAGARDNLAELKEREQLALAPRIPLPSVRGVGGVFDTPRLFIRWSNADVTPTVEYAVLESWLALGDVRIELAFSARSPLRGDPRVRQQGECSDGRLMQRVQIRVDLDQPYVLSDPATFLDAVQQAPLVGAGVTARTARDCARATDAQPHSTTIVTSLMSRFDADKPLDLESYGRRRWS